MQYLHDWLLQSEIDTHYHKIKQIIEDHRIEQLVLDSLTTYQNAIDDQRIFRKFGHGPRTRASQPMGGGATRAADFASRADQIPRAVADSGRSCCMSLPRTRSNMDRSALPPARSPSTVRLRGRKCFEQGANAKRQPGRQWILVNRRVQTSPMESGGSLVPASMRTLGDVAGRIWRRHCQGIARTRPSWLGLTAA
jgi:hypothetical protein